MLQDPPFIGDWFSERKLGSGSFGVVTLWKNKKTQENVAIKKCHMVKGKSASTEKHRERWENEVKLMTDVVKNDNIVKTIKVEPESFLIELMKTNSSGLQFLIMEYCEGGDLRRLLYKNTNCTGLKESEVRAVLKSLSNAISYLHSLKITHRDIKPENIVLKQFGEITVYKLTDLGYARALDIESLNASLVGTVEYLAPELIHNGKYNNSVDYWSMGIIGFEIICGHRPFIQHASIAQWIVQVQQKKSEHISISEDNNGQYTFSNKLCSENRISKCLKQQLEKWLTIALEWNPKQRGYIFEIIDDNSQTDLKTFTRPKSVTFADSIPFNGSGPLHVLKIFTMLDQIFDEKILTIFSLYTYEFLCYIIDEHTTMELLYDWIHKETGIEKKDIEIILPLEQTIDHINDKTKPIDLYLSNNYEKPMIYIVKKPTISLKKTEKILNDEIKPKIPDIIINLFENDKVTLRPHVLKQFASNSYYVIKNEKLLYETMLNGIKNYGFYLNHQITVFKNKISEMIKLMFGLKGSLELYGRSVAHSKEKLIAKTPDNMSPIFIVWDELITRMNSNLTKLCDASEKILTRYESVLRRSRESDVNKVFEKPFLSSFDIDILDKSYEHIKNEILNKKVNDKSHTKMLQFVYHCLKKRDIFLRDPEFVKLQKHLENIQIEIDEIKKTVDKAISQGEKYKADIMNMNNELMEKVWTLIEQYTKSEAEVHINGYSPPDFASMFEQLNIDSPNNTRKSFQIGSKVNNIPELKNSELLCFGEGPDLNSLLRDNESIKNAMNDLLEDGFKSLSDQYESLKISFVP